MIKYIFYYNCNDTSTPMLQTIKTNRPSNTHVKLLQAISKNAPNVDISSSCLDKLRTLEEIVEPLMMFTHLKVLVLSNNLIIDMQPLSLFINLHSTIQTLNLQCNNIRQLCGIAKFKNMQQLYLSYNSIEVIAPQCKIQKLTNLQTLHLAYNNLQSCQIQPIVKCSSLKILSLHGNPVVNQLSYRWVLKNALKSLLILDQKQICQDGQTKDYLWTANLNVEQKQLRFTQRQQYYKQIIKKLEHQKQMYKQRSEETLKSNPTEILDPIHKKLKKYLLSSIASTINHLQHQITANSESIQNLTQQYTNKLRNYAYKSSKKNQDKKDEVNPRISKQQQSVKKITKHQNSFYEDSIYNMIKQKEAKSEQQSEQSSALQQDEKKVRITFGFAEKSNDRQENNNKYSSKVRKDKKAQNIITFQQNQIPNIQRSLSQRKPKSKYILEELKNKQQQLKELQRILKEVLEFQKTVQESQNFQLVVYKYFFAKLTGINQPLAFTQSKKIRPLPQNLLNLISCYNPLINISEKLSNIIFGENCYLNYNRIAKISQVLEGKCLLQLINQAKIQRENQKQKQMEWKKQQKIFIKKFEKESAQLCRQWKKLQDKKQQFSKIRQKMQISLQREYSFKIKQLQNKYSNFQQAQTQQIQQIQLEKTILEDKVNLLREQATNLNNVYEHKYQEFVLFQRYFQDFKQEKQKIQEMKQQLEMIDQQLHNKQEQKDTINIRIKELQLQEQVLQSKVKNLQKTLKQYEQKLALSQRKITEYDTKITNLKQEQRQRHVELEQLKQTLDAYSQTNQQHQKLYHRNKKNVAILQQKLKNIAELEISKRQSIKHSESQLKVLQKDIQELKEVQNQIMAQITEKKKQNTLLDLQIRESQMTVENLRSMNETTINMINRQRQLRCSIMQLEVQNNQLLKMREILKADINKQVIVNSRNQYQRSL